MSRKHALPAIAVVGMLLLAGCSGLAESSTQTAAEDGSDVTVLDAVPNQAEYVVVADPVGLATDPTTETVANTLLDEFGQSAEYADGRDRVFEEINANISEAFAELGADAELTVSDVGPLATFGTQPAAAAGPQTDAQYAGVVLKADLTAAEVASLFEQATADLSDEAQERISKTTYNGVTLYTANGTSLPEAPDTQRVVRTQSLAFAVLDGEAGLHAAGSPEAVRDAIDAYQGNGPGLAADVTPPLDDRTYLSLAIDSAALSSATTLQSPSVPGNVTGLTGSLQTGNQSVIVTYSVSFDNPAAAQSAAAQLRENVTDSDSYGATVSADGRTVNLRLSASATETADLIQEYYMLLISGFEVDDPSLR